MARQLQGARKRIRIPRRILIASLLIQDPTSAIDDGAAGEPVARRTRSRRRAAATALNRLPEEIVAWEIFIRLPAKDVIRCHAVCRSWRWLASNPDFLVAHHRWQPSLPLVTFDRRIANSSKESGHPILERRRGRPVIALDDYFDNNGFKLHASCDGLLLLAMSDGRFSICNPATRECASLSSLTAAGTINILALYLHRPLGKYRVLYSKGRHHAKAAAYYIVLTVGRRGSPRSIGVPSDSPAMEKAMLAVHKMIDIYLPPPVTFHNYLHSLLGWLCNVDIVVFDTVVESFRSMCGPPDATSCCTQLCDMEGSIGFSCLDEKGTVARIWVLEDYEREIWSFKYHVKFPVEDFCHFTDTRHFILSCKGDVLVYNTSACYMFHCDNTGKLLEEFRWEPRSQGLHDIGHMFKESLVEHEFFLRRGAGRAGQPSFFKGI
ncbi:hypothetical protein VPH35_026965 [Triticum aestivum]|uniref:uncharacterized protein n=1 Tax=Triticum aestivum TaxID=4565 RepID=UPI000844CA31|nr:uncharacterized protein LOC123040626 [Triticum aestivum]